MVHPGGIPAVMNVSHPPMVIWGDKNLITPLDKNNVCRVREKEGTSKNAGRKKRKKEPDEFKVAQMTEGKGCERIAD